MTEQMKQAIEKAGEQICDMVGTWSEYLTEPALEELTAILTELVEEVQLFEKNYPSVVYAQSDLIDAAKAYRELTTCYRLGKTPSEKLFTRLNNAGKILAKIEKELEAEK